MNRITSFIRKKATVIFMTVFVVSCGFNAYPVSEDQKLGLQVVNEIEANTKEYPILNNPSATQYIQNIVNEIIKSPEVKYRNTFAYKAKIVNNDKVINAFCTPGGYIYVYTGLLKSIKNEATLAGVLGHEIAHAELRHSTERMTKAYGASMLMGIALKNNTNQNVNLAANLLTGLALLKNSRSDESESDEYSFKYLKTSKWYPGGIIYFFEEAEKNKSNAFQEFFSTHPMPANRVAAVKEMLMKSGITGPSEANLYTTQYQNFLKTL